MKSDKQLTANIRAILWDMDGVLVDSEDMHPILESETAKHFGMDFSPEKVRELYLGVQLETEFNDMIKRSGKENVAYSEMRKKRDQLLNEYLEKGIKAVPNSYEVISGLSQYKQGVVSSGERFWGEEALRKLGLLKYFEVVIFAEDVTNHKPYPDPYQKAAQVLGLNPSECLVVEDSLNGLKSGKAAGMKVVAFKTSHNRGLDFSSADFVVEDLREISGILNTKLV